MRRRARCSRRGLLTEGCPVQLLDPSQAMSFGGVFHVSSARKTCRAAESGQETRIQKRGACRRERREMIAGPPRAGQAQRPARRRAIRSERRDKSLNSYTEDRSQKSRPHLFQVVKTPDTSLETERSTMWGYPSSTVPLEAFLRPHLAGTTTPMASVSDRRNPCGRRFESFRRRSGAVAQRHERTV
jgi:hypothetical protein